MSEFDIPTFLRGQGKEVGEPDTNCQPEAVQPNANCTCIERYGQDTTSSIEYAETEQAGKKQTLRS